MFNMADNEVQINLPLVTVLIPVYNGEKYVQTALKSILNQTYKNLEVLIINDGSTDGSHQIIVSTEDERIRYVHNKKNLKLITTLNLGFDLAKGKYIARMDADDIAEPERIAKQLEFMESNPEIGISGTWFKTIGNRNSIGKYPADHNSIKYTALYQCPFLHPSVMIRTSVLRNHRFYYDSEYPHAEDFELWGRMAEVTKMANIPEVLMNYRHHESNISALENPTQRKNSSLIKQSFYAQMGVTATENDMDLFEKMNHQVRTLSTDELNRLGKMLTSCVVGNRKGKYLYPGWFDQTIAAKWLETCSNHTYYGWFIWQTYWKFSGLRVKPLSVKSTVKFLIKVLLRKKQ